MANVFITIPDFSLHGGIRVILEWANRLTVWHSVHLHNLKGETHCNWFNINPDVKLVGANMKGMDILIITSPHSIHFQDRPDLPERTFIFMQMCEHMFKPNDKDWQRKCYTFYTSKHHLISISKWNINVITNQFGRKGVTHYVGNGVNLDHFPISNKPKDEGTVLIEGWESGNSSKDPDHIGPKVAARLKADGYSICAYSAKPLVTMSDVPDEYYCKPSLAQLNELYERATILIKATKYDARSCAPMEAMTKGTVTVRGIIEGDDDLIDEKTFHDEFNCDPMAAYKFISDNFNDSPINFSEDDRIVKVELLGS